MSVSTTLGVETQAVGLTYERALLCAVSLAAKGRAATSTSREDDEGRGSFLRAAVAAIEEATLRPQHSELRAALPFGFLEGARAEAVPITDDNKASLLSEVCVCILQRGKRARAPREA